MASPLGRATSMSAMCRRRVARGQRRRPKVCVALGRGAWQAVRMKEAPTERVTHADVPAGGVALLAEKGRLEAALVTAREGAKITFVRPDGIPQRAAAGRFYYLGDARLDGPLDLAPFMAEVEGSAGRIALGPLHASLHDRSGRAPLRVDEVLEAAKGLAGVGCEGPLADYALAVAIFQDGLHFKLRDGLVHPEAPAAISETRARRAEAAALAARVGALLPILVGRLAGEGPCLPSEELSALVEVAAVGRESPHAELAAQLVAALGERAGGEAPSSGLAAPGPAAPWSLPRSCQPGASPRPLGRQVEDLLVAARLLPPHPNLAPLRAGIPRAFGPEVLAAAEAWQERVVPGGELPDLTGLRAYAIDDAETTEIDDAIAPDPVDPARVHVLIADVAAFVPPASLLDAAARARLTTLYLPDGRIPMLPGSLGEGPASLVAGEERTALVISATLGPDGKVGDIALQRARVRVAAQLTYDAVEVLLAGGGGDDRTGAELQHLERLATAHRGARQARGAVTFQRPEVNFVLAPDGRVTLKVGSPLSRARQLVAELMVLACASAAEFAARHGIPVLYRSQAAPEALPRELMPDPRTGRVDDPVAQSELMRRLKPTVVGTEPRPHWTLGVSAYVQLTSPIRRYADLVCHQQLAAWLATGQPAWSRASLDAFAGDLGRLMGPSRRADQESRRLFLLRWLAEEVEGPLEAVVLRDLGRKVLVDVTLLGLQEAVALRGKRKPGQRVRLAVERVDFEEDTVTFREV